MNWFVKNWPRIAASVTAGLAVWQTNPANNVTAWVGILIAAAGTFVNWGKK